MISMSLVNPKALRRRNNGIGFLTFLIRQYILGTSLTNLTLILKTCGRAPINLDTDLISATQGST